MAGALVLVLFNQSGLSKIKEPIMVYYPLLCGEKCGANSLDKDRLVAVTAGEGWW